MNKLSGTVISPDGKFAVYSVKKWNADTGKAASHLEYIEINSKTTHILTDPNLGKSDFNPQFSNGYENTLTFISTRSGSAQIWSIQVGVSQNNNEFTTATQVTNYPTDVISFKWAADTGNAMAISVQVYTSCIDDLQCTADTDNKIKERGTNTWATYDKLMIRHWDHWKSDKVSHIFVQKLKSKSIESMIQKVKLMTPEINGLPLDMMLGMECNSPVGPFGGSEQYDIAPNGQEVSFTGMSRTHDEAWNTGWITYTSTVGDKSIEATAFTKHTRARTQNPKYSPNGSKIAFLAMNRVGLESDSLHLEIYDRNTKIITNASGFYDRSVNDFVWTDEEGIIFQADDDGILKLYELNLHTKLFKFSKLANSQGDDEIMSNGTPIRIPNSKYWAVVRNSWKRAKDIWLMDNETLKFTQLTDVNKSLNNFSISDADLIHFRGGNGETVQGWILKPVDFDQNKKYPLAFLIHGGPEGAWESGWSYRWNPQLWVNRGYAVVMINPHGSIGQGQDFVDKVRNDWGGLPYNDLMMGLDYVLAQFSWIDAQRTCAAGASYGGYMVNWIQGQTDRFKCLITHDGVFSTLSMFYATEEMWFPMSEYCPIDKVGCKPWDKDYRNRYTVFSPESYVQNWKTPHLVIHGSNDFRIPISEGTSVFTALQLKNIPSRFLHFTEENHWVMKPENSIKWYDEVIGWMDKYSQESTGNKKSKKLLKK